MFIVDFVFVQVAVLVTDGVQTTDRGNFTDPALVSKDLQNIGIPVYSFGIGNAVDQVTLIRIASYEQKQVFRATDFRDLEIPAKMILASVCPGEYQKWFWAGAIPD